MDDKTLQALTALANKLGTTAEYLWGVLLKQAPITGTIDLLLLVILVVCTVTWCRTVYRKTRKVEFKGDGYTYKGAEWSDDEALFGALSALITVVITTFLVTVNLAGTLSALLNPEYWALMQVLK